MRLRLAILSVLALCALGGVPAVAAADVTLPAECATGVTASACVAAAEGAGFAMFITVPISESCYSDPNCEGFGASPGAGTIFYVSSSQAGTAQVPVVQFDEIVSGATAPCPSDWGCAAGTTVAAGDVSQPADDWGSGCVSDSAFGIACADQPSYVASGSLSGGVTATYPIAPVTDGLVGELGWNLPVVLAVVGALIALGVGLLVVRRWSRA